MSLTNLLTIVRQADPVRPNVVEDFLAVGAAYDQDRGLSDDLKAFHETNKYIVCLVYPFLFEY